VNTCLGPKRAASFPSGSVLSWLASTTALVVSLMVFSSPAVGRTQVAELADDRLQAKPDFDRDLHLASFDQVVETISQSHWDLELIATVFRPKAAELREILASAETIGEYRGLVEQLLGSLKQSHFGLIPAQAYSQMEARDRRGGSGYSGLTVRYIAPDFLITDVRPDSPAHQAGVRCGWKLVATEPADQEAMLEQAAELVATSTLRLETAASLVAQQYLSAPAGRTVEVKFVDWEGQTREIQWVMGPPAGQASKFGNLPEVAVEFRSHRLPENVGYLSFNAFLDAPRVMREFTQAIETFRDAEGLVIDLRGNMGGLMMLTMGMCGWFVTEPVELGKMQMRGTALNLKLNPRDPRYDKPVAVLIDAVSISAAEVMAGGMQDAGTARLFGQRTAGLVLPSNVVRLANGDGLQYAMSDYHSLSGRTLEIEGVTPDVEVPLDQMTLRRGVDPVLEAAVQWIITMGQN
jgi:carboxyl-terminal processing protease